MNNFFEHQDTARRHTGWLVVLFALAVSAIIAGVYAIVLVAMQGKALWDPAAYNGVNSADWWNPDALGIAVIGALAVVGGGTGWKIHQLAKGGGSMVCEQLGGRFVDFNTDSLAEQQLINVVEEMSIASGVSVPLLYVLDTEEGINAFAAGFTPNNAAVAVSRGALEMLDRDELQGVIAHEFSHILNGDMRLNIRMIGILHGILMLAITGRFLMHMMFGRSSSGSRSSRNSGGLIWIALAGVALFALGWVGRLFGQIIKSAISRQREYLADASAVQFTRNPDGLAGALMKIGGYSTGSAIQSPSADQISHLFFGDALKHRSLLNRLFSTHPPLKKRIRRIQPGFHGAFPPAEAPAEIAADAGRARRVRPGLAADGGSPGAAGLASSTDPAHRSGQPMHLDPADVGGATGQTSPDHVMYARGALEAIPDRLRQASRDTYSASAVVFGLLLDCNDPEIRRRQLKILTAKLTDGLTRETRQYAALIESLNAHHRLPLVETLVPALRKMSDDQHAAFVEVLDRLVEADSTVTLFEFSVQKLLKHRLKAAHGGEGRQVAQYYSLTPLRGDVVVLLSCLAHAGSHGDVGAARRAFHQGMHGLGRSSGANTEPMLIKGSQCSFDALDDALDRLSGAINGVKHRVVDAVARTALADDDITVKEAELLRAICEVIDVPLPPFLPTLPN